MNDQEQQRPAAEIAAGVAGRVHEHRLDIEYEGQPEQPHGGEQKQRTPPFDEGGQPIAMIDRPIRQKHAEHQRIDAQVRRKRVTVVVVRPQRRDDQAEAEQDGRPGEKVKRQIAERAFERRVTGG